MSLSAEQKRRNDEELYLLEIELLALYKGEQYVQRQINKILPDIKAFLDEQEIIVSIDAGKKTLMQLIEKQIFLQEDQLLFQEKLLTWAQEYKELEKQSTVEMRQLARQESRGIIQNLMEGRSVDEIWGTDHDLRIVLQNEIRNPSEVKKSGTHILSPVSIVAGIHASEEERQQPQTYLKNVITDAIKSAPNANLNLLVPVNSGQHHWMLVEAKIEKGEVKQATLIDSSHNAALQDTPAFKNVEKAIIEITPTAKVNATATGVQNNGSSCMDYTIQAALQIKYPKEKIIDAGLTSIRDAKNAEELRVAVTDKLIENVPQITEQKKKIEEPAKEIFANPPTPENLEKELFQKLAADEKARDLQVKFDALMAEKLDLLFIANLDNPKINEKNLVDEARKAAFEEMRRTFSFFQMPKKKTEKDNHIVTKHKKNN
ncbi:MAG: hypothetical protein ACD_46C00264G0001 [uncultured bacterium]|nr:MAG: hypothetical protein ACD_46C00264G0001 [uncultured bacterium]